MKGGKLKADDIRSLAAVAKSNETKSLGLGVFVSMFPLTKGMRADAAAAGNQTILGKSYPLMQYLTVEEIQGKRPRLPLFDAAAVHKKAGASKPQTGFAF